MASVRSRRRPRWSRRLLAGGVLLFAAGIGLLIADAVARLDASERALTLTADEREVIGEEADVIVESVRRSSLVQSLLTSSDVRTFSVELFENAAGDRDIAITEISPPVIVLTRGSWHPSPVAVPAFGGLVLMVGALFLGAQGWRRSTASGAEN